MSWVQFWLLTAGIYDAAYRVKNADRGRHFILTITVCLLLAFGSWAKGVL